jgi:hypothetical protein
MSFNHKLFFGVIDSCMKGFGGVPYESWLNVQYDLNVVTTEMYVDMESETDRHEAIWLLFRDALADALQKDSDNPLLFLAVGLILSMELEQYVFFYFNLEVACLVAEGTSISQAKKEVNDWFDEDDNRWFETPNKTRVYFNPDETVTLEPKKKKKAKKNKSS